MFPGPLQGRGRVRLLLTPYGLAAAVTVMLAIPHAVCAQSHGGSGGRSTAGEPSRTPAAPPQSLSPAAAQSSPGTDGVESRRLAAIAIVLVDVRLKELQASALRARLADLERRRAEVTADLQDFIDEQQDVTRTADAIAGLAVETGRLTQVAATLYDEINQAQEQLRALDRDISREQRLVGPLLDQATEHLNSLLTQRIQP